MSAERYEASRLESPLHQDRLTPSLAQAGSPRPPARWPSWERHRALPAAPNFFFFRYEDRNSSCMKKEGERRPIEDDYVFPPAL